MVIQRDETRSERKESGFDPLRETGGGLRKAGQQTFHKGAVDWRNVGTLYTIMKYTIMKYIYI